MSDKFNVDNEVLIRKDSKWYGASDLHNPRTVGIITEVDYGDESFDIRVNWGDVINCYRYEDLELVSKSITKKVILFNAPPRSGKDVAADYMMGLINSGEDTFLCAHHLSFKSQLVKMTSAVLNLTVEEYLEGYDKQVDVGVWHKDIEQFQIGEHVYSQRTALQHVSENVAKPMFGESVFGDALAKDISEREGIIFVSDSGFAAELQPIVDLVGAENVLVIRIFREDCTFEGDTRDYLVASDFPTVTFVDQSNNGSLAQFKQNIENIIKNSF